MALVSELDLPELDFADPRLSDGAYHQRLAELRRDCWLARSPIATVVLDREAAEFFLRCRATAFPGCQIAELFGITAGPLFDHIDANILNLTGERHRRLRSIVGPAFTPAAANHWRPVMRAILDRLWTDMVATQAPDAVAVLAEAYPALAIAAVLGAPAEDASRLREWSNWVQRQFDILALQGELPRIEQAVVEVYEYVDALLTKRREQHSDDLLGALLSAEADGERLSHRECVNLAVNVIAGAIDTTHSQLAHALHLFATHPRQWAALATTPALVAQAVQEVLRFEPVTPFTARICLEDVEHRGVRFPAGTIVAVCAERANRETDGGETFDITAERNGRLLTFGAGPHFCLGANLAQAELEEALGFLAPRLPDLAMAGPVSFGGIEGIYGVTSLPLRWSGRSGGDQPETIASATAAVGAPTERAT
ncbi:MAG: cytochrome P450 [Mycobacteriales bacterium]